MEQCIDLTEKRLSLWPSVEHFKMVQDWHQPRNPNKTYHPTTKDSVPIPIRVLDKIGELNCAPLDKLAIATSWAPLDFGLDEDDFFDWADELISEQGRSSSHFLYNLSWLGSRLYPSALKDLSDNQFLGFLGVFKFKEILSGSLRSSPVFSTPSDYFRDVKLLYNFIKSNSENTFQEFIKDSALALPEGIDRYRIMDLDVEFAGYVLSGAEWTAVLDNQDDLKELPLFLILSMFGNPHLSNRKSKPNAYVKTWTDHLKFSLQ